VEIQDLTCVLIQRATVVAHVIDINPDINYVLFHRRLRFALMVFQPLRYPSAMIALGAGGGVYIFYCRCVGSERLSNGKRKGRGNTKNGNRYLAWAYIEAANFAVRFNPQIKRYYQRKRARNNGIVAIKTVAHKLARACYYILRDQVAFDVNKAFT
jgi:hypothetical protein